MRHGTHQRILAAVVGVAVFAVAAVATATICKTTVVSERMPMWDMAEHGLDGVRLAEKLRALDMIGLLRELNRMSLWPPLFPLVEMPVFLVFGYGFETARAVVAVIFLLTALGVYWAGLGLDGPAATVAGAIAAAFFLVSPLVWLHATIVLLEMPGALLTVLALGAYARHVARPAARGPLIAACVLTTLLFFCKYNYALIWLATVAACEVALAASPAQLARELQAKLRSVDWRRPFPIFITVYACVLAAIVVTGGWSGEIAGHRLSITSIGNPVLILLWILLVTWLAVPEKRAALRTAWRRASTRGRTFVTIVGAPVLLWLLVPPHMKDMSRFLQNRTSSIPLASGEGLAYYPLVFLERYVAHPLVGVSLLLLALAPLVILRRLAPPARVVYVAAAVGLVAVALHPYKQPRFLLTVAPILWLAAGRSVALAIERLPSRRALYLAAALSVSSLVAASLYGVDRERLLEDFQRSTLPPAERVLAAITEAAFDGRPSAVIGTWNRLSPALVEWYLRQRQPGIDDRLVPTRSKAVRARAAPALADALAAGEVEVIYALEIAEGTPLRAVYARDNAWLGDLLRSLGDDRRLTPSPAQRLPGTDYQVIRYQRAGDGSE